MSLGNLTLRLKSSLFYKERMNFDDCPVTENFKNKFDKNLLDYFEIRDSEDCEINCNLHNFSYMI